MNRKEMLRLLLKQAQSNGFEFRNWYQFNIRPEWPGNEQALDLLALEGRHYTLLFSHSFARSFWRTGAHMSIMVPAATYPRVTADGGVMLVTRKPFTRRTIKPDVWKYHLRQMAASEDPIEYLGRFLPQEDQAQTLGLPAAAQFAIQA